jgi:hypothetical protein
MATPNNPTMSAIIDLPESPRFPFATPTNTPSPLSFGVADLHDLEWLLNHSDAHDTWAPCPNAPLDSHCFPLPARPYTGPRDSWVSRPDLQYPGVGQFTPAPPRQDRPLYVHPYRRPNSNNNRSPPTPLSASPHGRFRHRDQLEHPLSYNPIRRSCPYQLGGVRMVPNPTTISRGPRRRTRAHAPEHPRVNYPADLVPRPSYRHNNDRYTQPPTIRDLAYIAQIATALPSRYCLLTLQQALWITHHLEENVWPGLPWGRAADDHVQDTAVHEARFWIDDLHGGYAYVVEED